MRADGRAADELRPVTFERDFTEMTLGSTLVTFGRTRVLCTASVKDDVPRWMKGRGTGWVTAEYSMLPGSSPERVDRKVSGRTQEIQRLIGRSLRSVCDMDQHQQHRDRDCVNGHHDRDRKRVPTSSCGSVDRVDRMVRRVGLGLAVIHLPRCSRHEC